MLPVANSYGTAYPSTHEDCEMCLVIFAMPRHGLPYFQPRFLYNSFFRISLKVRIIAYSSTHLKVPIKREHAPNSSNGETVI